MAAHTPRSLLALWSLLLPALLVLLWQALPAGRLMAAPSPIAAHWIIEIAAAAAALLVIHLLFSSRAVYRDHRTLLAAGVLIVLAAFKVMHVLFFVGELNLINREAVERMIWAGLAARGSALLALLVLTCRAASVPATGRSVPTVPLTALAVVGLATFAALFHESGLAGMLGPEGQLSRHYVVATLFFGVTGLLAGICIHRRRSDLRGKDALVLAVLLLSAGEFSHAMDTALWSHAEMLGRLLGLGALGLVYRGLWVDLAEARHGPAVALEAIRQEISHAHAAASLSYRRKLADHRRDQPESTSRFPVGVYALVIGPDGEARFQYASPLFCELVGVEQAMVLESAQSVFDRVHAEDVEELHRRHESAVHAMQPLLWSGRFMRDGEVRWLRFQAEGARLDDGCSHWSGVVADVTASKLAEESLVESEARYRLLFETASDGIVYADAESRRFVSANSRFASMLGYAADEVLTLGVEDIHPAEALPEVLRQFEALAAGRIRMAPEVPVLRRDRTVFYADITANPITIGGQRLLAGFFRDVTQRREEAEQARRINADLEQRVRERTRELELARQAAEKANAAKTLFLSRMSHELRTPLNAILGFAQLMESDPEHPWPEAHREGLGEIIGAGHHLLQLVNEVLEMSRVESGRLELRLETVAVAPLVESCVKQVQPMAAQRRIRICAGCSDDCVVYADEVRIRQVLLNLLSNAVKYNQEGGTVEVSCESVAGERVRFMVRDTGPGIREELLPRLFQPFERLDPEEWGVEGTGIGLTLSKHLVEAMQGSIGVDSAPGAGSTFWFELPRGCCTTG